MLSQPPQPAPSPFQQDEEEDSEVSPEGWTNVLAAWMDASGLSEAGWEPVCPPACLCQAPVPAAASCWVPRPCRMPCTILRAPEVAGGAGSDVAAALTRVLLPAPAWLSALD